jgi:hypothetical protein
MSLGFTTADLAALKSALASGATEVQIGDRRVKYQSLKDMIAIIKMVQEELDGVTADTDNPSMIKASYVRNPRSDE